MSQVRILSPRPKFFHFHRLARQPDSRPIPRAGTDRVLANGMRQVLSVTPQDGRSERRDGQQSVPPNLQPSGAIAALALEHPARVFRWQLRRETPIPGPLITPAEEPTGIIRSVYRPSFCLVVQGAKTSMLGSTPYHCAKGRRLQCAGDERTRPGVARSSQAAARPARPSGRSSGARTPDPARDRLAAARRRAGTGAAPDGSGRNPCRSNRTRDAVHPRTLCRDVAGGGPRHAGGDERPGFHRHPKAVAMMTPVQFPKQVRLQEACRRCATRRPSARDWCQNPRCRDT